MNSSGGLAEKGKIVEGVFSEETAWRLLRAMTPKLTLLMSSFHFTRAAWP
jgi:hypothetical protein